MSHLHNRWDFRLGNSRSQRDSGHTCRHRRSACTHSVQPPCLQRGRCIGHSSHGPLNHRHGNCMLKYFNKSLLLNYISTVLRMNKPMAHVGRCGGGWRETRGVGSSHWCRIRTVLPRCGDHIRSSDHRTHCPTARREWDRSSTDPCDRCIYILFKEKLIHQDIIYNLPGLIGN